MAQVSFSPLAKQDDRDKMMREALLKGVDPYTNAPLSSQQALKLEEALRAPSEGSDLIASADAVDPFSALAQIGAAAWSGKKGRERNKKTEAGLRKSMQAEANEARDIRVGEEKLAERRMANSEKAGLTQSMYAEAGLKRIAQDETEYADAATNLNGHHFVQKDGETFQVAYNRAGDPINTGTGEKVDMTGASDVVKLTAKERTAATEAALAGDANNPFFNMLAEVEADALALQGLEALPRQADDAGGIVDNLIIQADTTLGAQEKAGTETGILRDRFTSRKPDLFLSKASESGIGSKNWDTDKEVQRLMSGLGRVDQPLENIYASLSTMARKAGNTEIAEMYAKKGAEASAAAGGGGAPEEEDGWKYTPGPGGKANEANWSQ